MELTYIFQNNDWSLSTSVSLNGLFAVAVESALYFWPLKIF